MAFAPELAPAAAATEYHDAPQPRERHLMLLPSMACQASCSYCFGPNHGPVMRPRAFDAALDWIDATTAPRQKLALTFHGGEPLLAGIDWYRRGLALLRDRFGDRLSVHLQSNLWLLDEAWCDLMREFEVSLGTSLDGPREINDRQRGTGYFERTLRGIETARDRGLGVGVICTFTRLSAPHYLEVLDFFAERQLSLNLHAAVCPLERHDGSHPWTLTPDEHAELFADLFDAYLERIDRMEISTFDLMARGLSSGSGGLCTFGDCLGGYLTVAPDGGLFTCNRFAHHPRWRVGRVQEEPGLDELAESPVWRRLRTRELLVAEECAGCAHLDYCRGGCTFNALAAGNGSRDPHCPAYRQLFDRIQQRALAEVFSEQNLEAVVAKGPTRHGLLRRGKLLAILRDGPHPRKVAGRARRLVAAAALGVSASPEQAVDKLDRAGLVTDPAIALGNVRALRDWLDRQSEGLVNAYIHVTYGCNLACSHCYAASGPGRNREPVMEAARVVEVVREAAELGFGKAVITGGEPLVHPQRDRLLAGLADLRGHLGRLETVLRTNLAVPLGDARLERLARATDQVVVSVDGDEVAHDRRRGEGCYARTRENLRRLVAAEPTTEVSITAILPASEAAGAIGDSVRELGRSLGVPVRFKPVLPLGRARAGSPPEPYSSLEELDCDEMVVRRGRVAATCGLGMNLSIEPQGDCYPCHALKRPRNLLGNALFDGLEAVVCGGAFLGLKRYTVDSNRRCRGCAVRYLCGGFCRAWARDADPDTPACDCVALNRRARELLDSALDALDADPDRWLAAGLPRAQADLQPSRTDTVTEYFAL